MILLIGYGFWGKNLARNFGHSLSAVYDLDYRRAEECKRLYPWIRAYEGGDDLENVLRDRRLFLEILGRDEIYQRYARLV